ncbi:MAG: hypothetical protein KAJ42_11715 [Gemmatimonadetes bacterium]|nr:hypothetical protein [Gemmatimonadota bacterium]
MAKEKPFRLLLPSPDARVARSPFEPEDTNFPDGTDASTKVVFVPIVQWGQMRIRGRITGAAGVMGFEFARPNRALDPAALPGASEAFVYTVGQPGIDGTAWVDGVEFSLEISAGAHQGENWLKITLNPAAAADIDFFDVSGELLGTYH